MPRKIEELAQGNNGIDGTQCLCTAVKGRLRIGSDMERSMAVLKKSFICKT